MPRHGQATEGIADDEVDAVVGHALDRPARIADDDLDRVARLKPSSRWATASTARVELEDGLPGARPGRLEVAREREATAADVEDVDRPAEPVEVRPGGVGEPPDVGELEVGRVGQVDVGVGQAVEDEDAAVGVGRSTSTAMQ